MISSSQKLEVLQKRSHALRTARLFFEQRNYIEVDCPSLCKTATIDAHIDPIETEIGFLHTSPEYLMKRLLCQGMEKIYQISHVFRKGEVGKKHNPEFTMIEWYQVGFSFEDMIEETLLFLKEFIDYPTVCRLSFKELFVSSIQIDPFQTTVEDLKKVAELNGVHMDADLGIDDWLHILFSHVIEPNMDSNILYVVYNFPKTQAALSQVVDSTAKRFEMYFQGVELANGYLELQGKDEHIERFTKENATRKGHQKKTYPLDPKFLEAIDHLPVCSGVSVGFDRLLMLMLQKTHIKDVLPFSFDEL